MRDFQITNTKVIISDGMCSFLAQISIVLYESSRAVSREKTLFRRPSNVYDIRGGGGRWDVRVGGAAPKDEYQRINLLRGAGGKQNGKMKNNNDVLSLKPQCVNGTEGGGAAGR